MEDSGYAADRRNLKGKGLDCGSRSSPAWDSCIKRIAAEGEREHQQDGRAVKICRATECETACESGSIELTGSYPEDGVQKGHGLTGAAIDQIPTAIPEADRLGPKCRFQSSKSHRR